MEYLNFVSSVKEELHSRLKDSATVTAHTTMKNNGKERIGLTISTSETNIFPTIYLEEFYRQYCSGQTLDDIAEAIIKLYFEVKFEKDWDLERIQNLDLAKSSIVCKLIHFEQNADLLGQIPFIPYLDLAIVFYLLFEDSELGMGSILITKEIQNSWGLCLSELYQIALRNTPALLPAELKPIYAVIQNLLNSPHQNLESQDSHLYVLTNSARYYGAACILYKNILDDIANILGENFYVLPSSIHETLILPERFSPGKAILDNMIAEINETQLSEEEVLSGHAYFYNRENKKLEIVN